MKLVMPALVAGIQVLVSKDVNGRTSPAMTIQFESIPALRHSCVTAGEYRPLEFAALLFPWPR